MALAKRTARWFVRNAGQGTDLTVRFVRSFLAWGCGLPVLLFGEDGAELDG